MGAESTDAHSFLDDRHAGAITQPLPDLPPSTRTRRLPSGLVHQGCRRIGAAFERFSVGAGGVLKPACLSALHMQHQSLTR